LAEVVVVVVWRSLLVDAVEVLVLVALLLLVEAVDVLVLVLDPVVGLVEVVQ
jgi:hypothetical protein